MNLLICGLPMSGKSYFGQKAALKLQWAFVDTDRLIENFYRKKTNSSICCREIYLLEGSEAFRTYEKNVIYSLQGRKNSVIALGGGALSDSNNTLFLKQIGLLIYLQCSLEMLFERLKQKTSIPAYLDPKDPEKSFEKMALQRLPIYKEAANAIIDVENLGEEEIITSIINIIT